MTIQEAITLVKECGFNIATTKHSECEKVVLNALEKQIPKKPIKIGEEYISERREWVYDYECPSCGNPYADNSYCSCCGQKLDWGSDTNGI
jgi:hypothetical protein